MERMTNLRELWLADGLGSWDAARGQRLRDPHPTDLQFELLASTFASDART